MSGKSCKNCEMFVDHSMPEDNPDEPNGYCCHPFHSTPASPHYLYGGVWTHENSYCSLWTKRVDDYYGVCPRCGSQVMTTSGCVYCKWPLQV